MKIVMLSVKQQEIIPVLDHLSFWGSTYPTCYIRVLGCIFKSCKIVDTKGKNLGFCHAPIAHLDFATVFCVI
jgi:hypothetical protein